MLEPMLPNLLVQNWLDSSIPNFDLPPPLEPQQNVNVVEEITEGEDAESLVDHQSINSVPYDRLGESEFNTSQPESIKNIPQTIENVNGNEMNRLGSRLQKVGVMNTEMKRSLRRKIGTG